jgi:hypothetical protein
MTERKHAIVGVRDLKGKCWAYELDDDDLRRLIPKLPADYQKALRPALDPEQPQASEQPLASGVLTITSLDSARDKREAAKLRQIGNCARGVSESCGMRDPAECRVHGPYIKE